MAREKKTVITEKITTADADKIFGEYAEAYFKLKETSALLEQEIATVRDKYSPKLLKLEKITTEKFDLLQHFAETNSDLFEEKKSAQFTHGLLGFRTGTPKLKLLKSFNWDRVMDKLKQNLKLQSFIRNKPEVDKEKLIASRDDHSITQFFPEIGVVISQDETFFVECKEEVPA